MARKQNKIPFGYLWKSFVYLLLWTRIDMRWYPAFVFSVIVSKRGHRFDLLNTKRAFVHWCIGEGMEEGWILWSSWGFGCRWEGLWKSRLWFSRLQWCGGKLRNTKFLSLPYHFYIWFSYENPCMPLVQNKWNYPMFIFYDSVMSVIYSLFLKEKQKSVTTCLSIHEKKRKCLGYMIWSKFSSMIHVVCGVHTIFFFLASVVYVNFLGCGPRIVWPWTKVDERGKKKKLHFVFKLEKEVNLSFLICSYYRSPFDQRVKPWPLNTEENKQ